MTLEELIIPDGMYFVEFGKSLVCRDKSYDTNYAKYVKNWLAFDVDPLESTTAVVSILNSGDGIIITRMPCISYGSITQYKKEQVFYIPDENTEEQELNLCEDDVLAVVDTLPPIVNDLSILYNVGDHVYLTKTEQQMRYHGCCFRPEICKVPIMRKIISIVNTKDRVMYQLSGCGIHFCNKDVGDFVFNTYEDANKKLNESK